MDVIKTAIEGCLLLKPKLVTDSRGYFMESYNERSFDAAVGTEVRFVQDNQSFSQRGVVRGLHYQTGAFAQAKLVRVIQGQVLDVAVDIRPGSDTFGRHVAVVLSADNNLQLFIPRGFAHGFAVLSDNAIFAYKCDNFYNRDSEGGIRYDDKELGIDWQLDKNLIVSEKDLMLPDFKDARPAW